RRAVAQAAGDQEKVHRPTVDTARAIVSAGNRTLSGASREPAAERVAADALGSRAGSAALSDLQPVAVGVLELRDVPPGELEHIRDELDAARLELLDRLPAIVGLDRDRRRGASHRRLGLPWRSGPEHELEVVALDADGQEPRPVGRRVLDALLEAEDVGVEVERLVL